MKINQLDLRDSNHIYCFRLDIIINSTLIQEPESGNFWKSASVSGLNVGIVPSLVNSPY